MTVTFQKIWKNAGIFFEIWKTVILKTIIFVSGSDHNKCPESRH
jgi:hypothetical protein